MVSIVAAVSGVYDVVVGLALLAAPVSVAALFGVSPVDPPIFATTNGLFLLAVGIGYYFPWRDPQRHRWYMWIMGPLLKGGGAFAFVADHLLRDSPPSFLLFAVSDGLLAILTVWALLRDR